MQNSECPASCPDILCYTKHEHDKLEKEVSSEDYVLAQNYCQNKFLLGHKQQFAELALIYIGK